MSKKRGLSVEEKRKIVLEIFHESQTVWLLKVREPRPSLSTACTFL